jgi:hypothetical protein
MAAITKLDAGRIIHLAHSANRVNWSGPMHSDYAALTSDFLALLRQREIPFVIVGGIALLQYVSGRNTEDIDIILAAPRLAELPEMTLLERNEMFAKADFNGLRVDLWFVEHPFLKNIAQEFSAPRPYTAGELPTATIEGLILLKLFALPSLYRQMDLDRVAIYEADLTQLLHRTDRSDSYFTDILGRFLPGTDLRELGGILAEIRQKLARLKS